MQSVTKNHHVRWAFLSLMALGAAVTATLFHGLMNGH